MNFKFYRYKGHQIAISAQQVQGEAAREVQITSPADRDGMQHTLFLGNFYDHFNMISPILKHAKLWIDDRIAEANRK